jgi:TPR repeat protein
MQQIAAMLMTGTGVKKDKKLAQEWYQKAETAKSKK